MFKCSFCVFLILLELYFQFQIASAKTQADAGNKVLDHLVTKVNTIDGSVNNHENGLVSENIRLKDEVTYLIKTCKNYEDRFIEMETEVQVSTVVIT